MIRRHKMQKKYRTCWWWPIPRGAGANLCFCPFNSFCQNKCFSSNHLWGIM